MWDNSKNLLKRIFHRTLTIGSYCFACNKHVDTIIFQFLTYGLHVSRTRRIQGTELSVKEPGFMLKLRIAFGRFSPSFKLWVTVNNLAWHQLPGGYYSFICKTDGQTEKHSKQLHCVFIQWFAGQQEHRNVICVFKGLRSLSVLE